MCSRNHPSISLLLLLLLPLITAVEKSPAYTPTDFILLNCGASSTPTSLDGRHWDADSNSQFLPSNSKIISTPSQATHQNASIPQIPYITARSFNSIFTYTFPVSPGPKFLRLYFNPTLYSNFNSSESFFSIKANNYTLRSEINPPVDYLVKEFIITVGENQMLNLTFNPSPNSSAFINGIEIVSMSNDLYYRENNRLKFVGSNYLFDLYNSYAFETVYRINVGGASIGGNDDTGMYRTWVQDSGYIDGGVVSRSPGNVSIKYTTSTPAFVVPDLVYSTIRSMGNNSIVNLNYNLTWLFSVDSGFNYLLRFHFCEFGIEVNEFNRVIFSIFINNQTTEEQTDVFYLARGKYVPMYKDYVVLIPNGSLKEDLWVALHPSNIPKPSINDAFLNGLEIFKLNNSDGSLAPSKTNDLRIAFSPEKTKTKRKSGPGKVITIAGFLLCGILGVCLISLFFICKKRRLNASNETIDHKSNWLPFFYTSSSTPTPVPLLPTHLCHQFTLPEIRIATINFDNENVIGSGGFGTVYKGCIKIGFVSIPVAVTRLDSSSKQGTREFHTEIEMLSTLRHVHLVSLIGYCDEEDEMILVYEFMDQGNLQDHIYKAKKVPFPWKQRLTICIGAAKGLHYLHTGVKNTIIHRNMKSSNILLDSNFVAEVSDFGLSKIGPISESQNHVSTVVRGTFGYLDPEYYRRKQLTEKSDVYSFGVVLLEVIYGRAHIFLTEAKEHVNLVAWA